MSMPVSAAAVVWMMPAMSPSPISRMATPAARRSSISRAWRGRGGEAGGVEDAGRDLAHRDALGVSQCPHVVAGRGVERDGAGRVARTDRNLVHVHVGRVKQAALLGDGNDRDRIGQVLGANRL